MAWKSKDHMMAGVQAALASPNTPLHLRPHLQQRITGGTNPMKPIKTIVGPTGMTPIRTTVSAGGPPLKTLVGNTARPPIKARVPSLAQRPIKTVVGSTAAPPFKTTPGTLGMGANGPRPRGVLARPNATSGVNRRMRGLGNNDANLGRSVKHPSPVSGPPNPVLDNRGPGGYAYGDQVKAGGMGQTLKNMQPGVMRRGPLRGQRGPTTPFYGG